jgi:hypothetical protein
VYLLQRYQGEAVARLIGGGDSTTPAPAISRPASQPASRPRRPRAAPGAGRLIDSLRAEYLALPASVLDILTPPTAGYERSREYFATRMDSVFDACRLPKRAPRRRPASCWTRPHQPRGMAARARPAAARRAEVLGRCCKNLEARRGAGLRHRRRSGAAGVQLGGGRQPAQLLDGGKLHAQVAAEVRQSARELAQWLQRTRARA